MIHYDCVVIGGGVIGAACAAVLSKRGHQVLLFEKERKLGQHTSSRNSGVIHAGLHSPPNSRKSRLCVEGRQLLYQRCKAHGIGHKKTGKFVVATSEEELPALEHLLRLAEENGVPCSLESSEFVREREPNVHCVGALWSPESGIVDAEALLYDYAREAKENGSTFCLRTEVCGLERTRDVWRVSTKSSPEEPPTVIEATWVVNASGLQGTVLARLAGDFISAYETHFCKGQYFVIRKRPNLAVSRLIYPVPGQGHLGIHLTVDIGGGLLLGPDATFVTDLDYEVQEARREHFLTAAKRYLPSLRAEDLSPGYSGIRPKLHREDEPSRDFVIEESQDQDRAGLIHLLGIESPGLTASEAIAQEVARLIRERSA